MSELSVPRRRLGSDGPEIPLLSLGSWHIYDRMDFRDAVTMVSRAVELGVNMFDVGVYGFPGQTPVYTDVLFSAIVRAAGLARDDYILSVKLWLEGYPEHSLRDQLDNALFRAGTDRADIAILGDIRRPDLDLRRLAHDLAALEADGVLGCWGVNNWSATSVLTIQEHAQEAGSAGPRLAQLKYSPCRRSIPDGEPFAKVFASGVALQASDILEGGILAGNLKPERMIGRDPGDVRERIKQAAGGIREVADGLGASMAQVCVAFALTHPSVANVLFGSRGERQLLDNAGAFDLVERVGADQLRALLDPFWVDRDAVDPEGP